MIFLQFDGEDEYKLVSETLVNGTYDLFLRHNHTSKLRYR